MHSILKKIVDQKLLEIEASYRNKSLDDIAKEAWAVPPARDFLEPLQRAGEMGLIAEVKKASPSKGVIREDFNPVEIAKAYASAGASCLSVLTDEHFFQGHRDFLVDVSNSVDLPVLRKDFVIDTWQVYDARAAGADAVLLIAECLDASRLFDLHALIEGLGMTALVELYDRANIDKVLACNPSLVGVNNRDLNTFEVNLEHSIEIRKSLPDDITFVSESGISTHSEVARLMQANVDAILVGESLMRSDDIAAATKRLLGTD
ncbi:indole-3-glycerol phosphate synthase TrpC [Mariniblastus fucicola]|uniref:Indole-3-glycerol phosphate synthase n=1 Tax=Mariniblastus fucicola TaxID=980251 RepID=A0A5B9PAE8_9BACT|nr:indole-3-glycerol phosphate synthase TrpC [Mariniblastus fucicola]QEG21932.1 Indole-3-glycerol phosphate synthase [Mariniblastus fucicola]